MRPLSVAPYPVLLPQTPRLLWRLPGGPRSLFLSLSPSSSIPTSQSRSRLVGRAPRAYTLTSAQIHSLALVFHLHFASHSSQELQAPFPTLTLIQ